MPGLSCQSPAGMIPAHLRNPEATAQPGRRHEGILLYAVVDVPVRIDVRLEGFSIRARSIDLGGDWGRIRADMLSVIA